MILKHFEYHCYGCGSRADLSAPFYCGDCGEPRAIRWIGDAPPACLDTAPQSLWHYAPMLPVGSPDAVVSLGEGATPLVPAPASAAQWGFADLRFKNEMANPTGSFKDRQISVGISHVRETGGTTVAAVSSGNVAVATAAYAARAGMRAMLFMHGQAGLGKMAQAAAFGATLIQVAHPSPSVVFDLAIEACARFRWRHLSTAGIYEPFNVEGAKTIAYELYHQYQGDLPDWIVAPVGGGGLLGGLWRGLLDLKRAGRIERLPRLAGVQATGCAPLKLAMEHDTPFLETLKHPWPNPKTIAGGIADDILFDGHTVLPALRRTNGTVIVVDDPAIEEGRSALARREGLFCELTTAVVPAALPHLAELARGQRVCALLTGNGMKDLHHLVGMAPASLRIPPSIDALAESLQS